MKKTTTRQTEQTVSAPRPSGASDDVRCPACNCGRESLQPCDGGGYFCHECGNYSFHSDSEDCHETENDFAGAIIDLKSVIFRVSVIAAHCLDLVQAHTPEATRTLTLLNEIDLLTKDGMTRIQQTGLEL